ncbi:hydroxymethylbilane synthase [Cyclobacterium marinum]|uniref:hydroxymethylbilane synthase n=1 Tax=Cyclobacterium marinum TaxID=104 RepID=UPI0011ED9C59|nr:hydroxymethylbilane synthase [Cyclobacterium marinum]MBI0399236.1 hydroxymethylbilane synthase [Cyclobacterium marinum]
MKSIRIGTRGSKLALYQANYVADLLNKSGINTTIVTIETKGDKVLDVSISKIGSKGVFTEELETKLAVGEIDIAVHSAKDLPSRLPEGFETIAFTEREKVNDIIISHKDDFPDLNDPSKPIVLGTSATRRVATLKYFYPHIKTVDVRGNLQTRVSKMENGLCDGLLLAYAGVHRMGYDQLIKKELPLSEFIPAVGQGSIGVEIHSGMDPDLKKLLKAAINHPKSAACLTAERSFLSVLEGGCSIPAFALAHWEGDRLILEGGLMQIDGKERLFSSHSGTEAEASLLGKKLAEDIKSQGGDLLLKEIKQRLNG